LLRCLCHWGVKVNLDELLDVKKKRDYRKTPEDMPDTIQCYIFGATRTGKTSLLRSFIGQEFDSEYTKTEEQHSVVHLFEYKEKNYYLVVWLQFHID
jgi:Ras family protein T1